MARAILAACLIACSSAPPSGSRSTSVADPTESLWNASKRSAAENEWVEKAKEVFARHWLVAVTDAAHRNDPTGVMYSIIDRRAVVTWRFADDGRISGAEIFLSSGVQYLDDVALQSVKGVKWLDPPPPELTARELRIAFTLKAVGSCDECVGLDAAR